MSVTFEDTSLETFLSDSTKKWNSWVDILREEKFKIKTLKQKIKDIREHITTQQSIVDLSNKNKVVSELPGFGDGIQEILDSIRQRTESSPRKDGNSPRKAGDSPRTEGPIPKLNLEVSSPKKEGLSPRKDGNSPKKLSPRMEGLAPNKEGNSPKKLSPRMEGLSPNPSKEGNSPKKLSPRMEGLSPKKLSPRMEGGSPKKEDNSPRKGNSPRISDLSSNDNGTSSNGNGTSNNGNGAASDGTSNNGNGSTNNDNDFDTNGNSPAGHDKAENLGNIPMDMDDLIMEMRRRFLRMGFKEEYVDKTLNDYRNKMDERKIAESRLVELKSQAKKYEDEIEKRCRALKIKYIKMTSAIKEMNNLKESTLIMSDCTCSLACPHTLLMESNGRIQDPYCLCIQEKQMPCLCVTHIMVLNVSIDGKESGQIEIHLAGRTSPHSIYRFFVNANRGKYNGTLVDKVVKNNCICNRLMGPEGKVDAIQFENEDAKQDSEESLDLLPSDKFWFGYSKEVGFEGASFMVFMGGSSPYYRTIGKVVRGQGLVQHIHDLPVKNFCGGISLSKIVIDSTITKINVDSELHLEI